MCHVTYLFAQLQTIFVRDRTAILEAYTGNRGVGIEHLVPVSYTHLVIYVPALPWSILGVEVFAVLLTLYVLSLIHSSSFLCSVS